MERTDGCVREAAVRCGDTRGRASHGAGHKARRDHCGRRRRLRGGRRRAWSGERAEPRVNGRRRIARASRGKDPAWRGRARRSTNWPQRMLKRPLFFANWKMNHGPTEARAYIAAFLRFFAPHDDRTVAMFPPALSLTTIRDARA